MPSKDEELAKDQPKEDASAKKAKPAEKAQPKAKVSEAKDDKSAEKEAEKAAEKAPVVKVAQKDSAAGAAGSGEGKKAGRFAKVTNWGRDRGWKSTAITIGSVVVALAAVIVIVFGVLVYVYKSDNAAVKAVSAIVPYPVMRVNGHFVSYNDYLFEVDANERAYQNNAKLNNQPAVDFKSADGKKLVEQIKQHSIQTLESNELVAQLAAQNKVKVTDKDVNDLINQLYSRYGGKDTLLKTLNQIYGWNLGDLKKVVRQQLLAQDLQNKVTSDPQAAATAKSKAQEVLGKIQAGADFSAEAKTESQASDAANGGDMGTFSKGQVPDEVYNAASALQVGQVSDVVKDQYGYTIIKVLDKGTDGSIHAQEILIKTTDFNDYFQQKLKDAKVNTYIKV